jgi:hypothetical protein
MFSRAAYAWSVSWGRDASVSCETPKSSDKFGTGTLDQIVTACVTTRWTPGDDSSGRPVFTAEREMTARTVGSDVEFRIHRGAVWRLLTSQHPDSVVLTVDLAALDVVYQRRVAVTYARTHDNGINGTPRHSP